MAHHYRQPIQVTTRAGRPLRFLWRGREYIVAEILSVWRLRDRWWEAPGPTGASDRHYYRLRCADDLVCEVYYDAACDVWMLDRVHD
jgi:Domain of unknown function (DUF6504)